MCPLGIFNCILLNNTEVKDEIEFEILAHIEINKNKYSTFLIKSNGIKPKNFSGESL